MSYYCSYSSWVDLYYKNLLLLMNTISLDRCIYGTLAFRNYNLGVFLIFILIVSVYLVNRIIYIGFYLFFYMILSTSNIKYPTLHARRFMNNLNWYIIIPINKLSIIYLIINRKIIESITKISKSCASHHFTLNFSLCFSYELSNWKYTMQSLRQISLHYLYIILIIMWTWFFIYIIYYKNNNSWFYF